MSLTHKFEIAGHEGYITVGLYADGQPGELFVQMSKEGSTIGGLMDTVATLTSIALQYGVPLEQLVNKFAYQRFEPSGFTSNPDIRTAFSITDYVFRWLGCEFIKGYREATSPDNHQTELPMPEIEEMEQQAVNRPVPELSIDRGQPRTPARTPTGSKPPSAPPTWASSARTAAPTRSSAPAPAASAPSAAPARGAVEPLRGYACGNARCDEFGNVFRQHVGFQVDRLADRGRHAGGCVPRCAE